MSKQIEKVLNILERKLAAAKVEQAQVSFYDDHDEWKRREGIVQGIEASIVAVFEEFKDVAA